MFTTLLGMKVTTATLPLKPMSMIPPEMLELNKNLKMTFLYVFILIPYM